MPLIPSTRPSRRVLRVGAVLLSCIVSSCAKSPEPTRRAEVPVPGVGGPPEPAWAHAYDATLFAKAIDVSCAPRAADPGVDGCIALVRYRGRLKGSEIAEAVDGVYGRVAFVRMDAAGEVLWTRPLMSGFAPISAQFGRFIDDDLRVHHLANDEFLVSGTYEGRVLFGTPGGSNQELGPATNRNLFMIEFHRDGTFDNWEDTGNENESHALGVAELPDTRIAIVGRCQGDVPLDTGTFPCGGSVSGYVLTVLYDGSTVGAITFGGTRSAEAADVVADAAGNLFVSGTFEEQIQFGDAPADIASGEDDGFLVKFAPDGSRPWIVTAGSLGHDRGGRVARVTDGTLWTALVSAGARLGKDIFPGGGQVVARLDDAGNVVWTTLVAHAQTDKPLGLAVADDDSFALYGNGFLARFDRDGTLLWERTDGDVAGAAFTRDYLVVAATAVGRNVLGTPVATTGDDAVRAALVGFPR